MLPGLDGFRVLRALRTEALTMPVLILTARGEETDKVRGLKLGADDYLTKPFGLLEFLARVEALLRGASGSVAAAERIGDVEIDRATRTVRHCGREVELTPKEYELLLALVDRNGTDRVDAEGLGLRGRRHHPNDRHACGRAAPKA